MQNEELQAKLIAMDAKLRNEEAFTLDQPCREPIRPYWSMMQFVATKAKPAFKSRGES